EFVRAGIEARPFEQLRGGVFLGSDAFVEKFRDQAEGKRGISKATVNVLRPPLGVVLQFPDGIREAADRHGYSAREIAALLGIHHTTVIRRLRASRLGSGPILK